MGGAQKHTQQGLGRRVQTLTLSPKPQSLPEKCFSHYLMYFCLINFVSQCIVLPNKAPHTQGRVWGWRDVPREPWRAALEAPDDGQECEGEEEGGCEAEEEGGGACA